MFTPNSSLNSEARLDSGIPPPIQWNVTISYSTALLDFTLPKEIHI